MFLSIWNIKKLYMCQEVFIYLFLRKNISDFICLIIKQATAIFVMHFKDL